MGVGVEANKYTENKFQTYPNHECAVHVGGERWGGVECRGQRLTNFTLINTLSTTGLICMQCPECRPMQMMRARLACR